MSQIEGGQPSDELTTLKEQLDRLSARVEAIEQTSDAATKAGEAACRHASGLINVVRWVGTSIILVLGLVGTIRYLETARIERRAAEVVERAEASEVKVNQLLENIGGFADKVRKDARRLLPDELPSHVTDELENRYVLIRIAFEFAKALGAPLDADDHRMLGDSYVIWKDYERAVQAYDRVLEINPDHARVHWSKGVALVGLRKHDEALALFDRALKIMPDRAELVYNKGAALMELERWDEALASFDRALEIKPDFAEAHYELACAYSYRDEPEKAVSALRRAIELEPKYRDMAKTGPAFENLRDNSEFRRLVGLDDGDS